jgi:phosphoenolpyruvate-protein kinase (PTS system EI component)
MTVVAEGFNAFETDKEPSGAVIYLPDPQSVVKLIQSGKLKDHILLVRGGTTTFLAPALSMGAIGLITMSGAPESHLGILSREFQIPCIMTAHLSSSESRYEVGNADQAHFDEIVKELNGKQVTLKCANAEVGQVVI